MTAQPIVVGYDVSEGAQTALGWALDEAARTGSPVTLLYAFEWQGFAAPLAPVPVSWPDQRARQAAQTMVDAAVSTAEDTHPQVAVTGSVVPGAAATTLLEHSPEARLVVLGSRGHGGFSGLLLGSTSVAVSAHAHCPVVVVRGHETPGGPVVVGVDGSDCALFALEFAVTQAAEREAGLRVVRSVAAPASRWQPPEADLAEQIAAARAELTQLVAGWREKYPQVAIAVDVIAEAPARTLVEASRGAQLVVVGSRGRGGFRGLLLGSVSQQLLHHAWCPVAVVRQLSAATG